MSDDSTASGSTLDMEALTDTFRRWYHVPALVLAVVTMFFIRIQSWQNFVQDGNVYLSGNDAWYHLRMVEYSVENGLSTMPYEIWTGFATGKYVGQFGTLFDQLIATGALILGLGDPSSQQIATAVLFAPAVFGALVAIPTFLIARRFGGNLVGVVAAFILALLPGLFLQRGTVGAADHNVAEPLFMSLAVLGLLIAIAVGDRELPVWEQLLDRDIAGLRTVLGWSLLAGTATAAYMWVWPPGVILVGIFGIFLLVSLSSDVVSGVSPDHTAIPATIAMATTTLLMLIPLDVLGFSASGFSLLQVIAPLVVAFGAVFLSWLGREWERRDIEPNYYPGAVGGLVVVGFVLASVIVPGLVDMIVSNLIRYVGLSAGATTRTISEAQPFLQSRADQLGLGAWQAFFFEYGAAFFLALLGGLWMILRPHLLSSDSRRISMAAGVLLLGGLFVGFPAIPTALGGILGLSGDLFGLLVLSLAVAAALIAGDYPTEQILLVVWAAFMLAAALTQVRFNYYLVVPVAILAAYAVGRVIDDFGVTLATLSPRSIDWSHVMLVVTIVLLLFAPMVAPISFANQDDRQVQMSTAVQTGANAGPGAVTEWDSTLGWMQNNTPEVGNYGGAGNADQLDYDGTYAIPENDDYDYPEGSYGVMSWWDYGHWITVLGERIPVANPFQQHATQAANYLLAGDEETANERLGATDEDDAETQYVAVDYKMVDTQGKFSAPTVFYNANDSLSYDNMTDGQILGPNAGTYLNSGYRPPVTTLKTQRYYESQMVRLYHHHGSAVDANTVIQYENREYEQYENPVPTYETSRTFRSSEAAQEFAENDSNAIVGGVADFPREDLEALEHYRLVRVSEDSTAPRQKLANLEFREGEQPTWVKLFERVPGATIEGEGPADSTVTATVELESNAPYNDSTFTYTQHAETDANGDFEMTLPYASTDYDEWGPEDGYTNTSVRATGPYEFSTPTSVDRANETMTTHSGTVDVPEGVVIGASEEPITVTLDEQVIDTGQEDNQTDTNTTDTTNETVQSVGTTSLPEVTAQPTE
ncbi:oligosaccharyl transferase, archaeosortase A system-associated [Halodesulfurarchaeum sp. HSR-GB]|uniref:oligosaccharyl transferase, archaeosortase A system-associated n=1 Tax=Halodesulfurarchaeum sp. HSR-GB TaxID=3074077 RepID=UPI002860418C|nr:oligosaccharyl transferase, archaeosortase A system-associated [Halodesulfurarchaeum sp. HSR-GB]MDR5657397.1 oligosaccharyl transferase, archaeosortase A system-associated [Halodesulfurarchaeum sp. HSR-GB]